MLGDTLTITLPVGGAKALNKINQDSYGAEYLLKGSLSEFRAKVRHSTTNAGMERHNIEFTEKVYATATEEEYLRKVYFVIENIPSDDDDDNIHGLADWLTTAGNPAKLFGWQS